MNKMCFFNFTYVKVSVRSDHGILNLRQCMQHFEFWLRVRCLVAIFFDVVQMKIIVSMIPMIKAIIPPFLQGILVFNLICSVLKKSGKLNNSMISPQENKNLNHHSIVGCTSGYKQT